VSGGECLLPDYGCGNLRSIVRMVEKVEGRIRVVSDPRELRRADRIVVAGVGAFDHGMRGLTDGGWIDELSEAALHRRIPTLGICLGMQLLCRSSDEGDQQGLGWLQASTRRFEIPAGSALKVPHMGWNSVRVTRSNALIPGDAGEQRFYFVHSFHVVCDHAQDVLATAHHGYEFAAAVGRDNVFGVQFHPEKSHRFGMALMQRFVTLRC
jgi:imidazole glycerol-phosphate synthase subunit HisH